MIASAAGDPSNVDNFTRTGDGAGVAARAARQQRRPAQREHRCPGEGGGEALIASLDGAFFMAGNNLNRPAKMELQVKMPAVLAAKGWKLKFDRHPHQQVLAQRGREARGASGAASRAAISPRPTSRAQPIA